MTYAEKSGSWPAEKQPKYKAWIEWATKQADRLDPFVSKNRHLGSGHRIRRLRQFIADEWRGNVSDVMVRKARNLTNELKDALVSVSLCFVTVDDMRKIRKLDSETESQFSCF